MKISFPHMGQTLGYKKILEKLGHEVIVPPKPTQRTFELGVKYSPEFLCYPFKVMMGTYFEVAEQGAELIFSSGGTGPCRAGYYGELHKKILEQQGYDIPILIFDSIFEDTRAFIKSLKTITNKTPIHKIAYALLFAYRLICYMDNLEKQLKILRAYEIKQGSFDKAWAEILEKFDGCETFRDLKAVRRHAEQLFAQIPIRTVAEDEKMRVGLVGEIYVLMESSTNMEIERKLNALGVEVYNVQSISDWLKHHLIPKFISREQSHKVQKKGKQYSALNTGGHDLENIGWIIDFADKGFDAVIHLMPFSCLPELVTRSIIPTMSEDLNMPILSTSLDEQTGTANMQTRLEAFIELVKNKKAAANAPIDVPEFVKVKEPQTESEMVAKTA